MARDRELLSDKDFFRKTSDIAEHMRNCKITVVFWDDDNKVIQDKNDVKKFMLNVATPAKKGIEKFTAFNHEIGHIIMESPIPEANKLVTGWVDEFILQNRIAYNDTIVPERVRDTYWNMMNLLEDQRIESLMRRLWLANEKRFDKALKKTGKFHKECNDNPVSVMLNIRFFRKDLVKDHDNVELFTKALDDVENTGRLGALIVLKRLKPVMDKWLKESLNEDFPPSFEFESLDGRDTELMETDESLIKEKNIEEIIDNIESDEDYEEELTKSMEEGTDDLNELRSSLTNQIKENPLRPSYVKPVKRYPVEYNIDHHLSHSLKNIFRKISEMPKNIIGYDGDELDIETYIENKIRGYNINKCFEDKKIDHGLSVVISIDGSGSMERGQKMSKARDLVSTLFHSVKDFPSVELKANVWSSDNKGNVGITDINSLDDCKNVTNRVSSSGSFPYTPTHLAIDYASRVAKSMKGRKKLIIMITDGEPQYQSWGYAISPSTLLKMNRKSLLKAKRNVTEIIVFAVAVNNSQLNNLRYVFNRKRVVYIRRMDEGVKLISNKFKLAVLDTLK
jgi:nitric oxide reductase activation protein